MEATVKLLATGREGNRQAAVIPMIESIRRTQSTAKKEKPLEWDSLLLVELGWGLSRSWLQAN